MEQIETVIGDSKKKTETMLKESIELQKIIKEQIREKIKQSVLEIKGKHHL